MCVHFWHPTRKINNTCETILNMLLYKYIGNIANSHIKNISKKSEFTHTWPSNNVCHACHNWFAKCHRIMISNQVIDFRSSISINHLYLIFRLHSETHNRHILNSNGKRNKPVIGCFVTNIFF